MITSPNKSQTKVITVIKNVMSSKEGFDYITFSIKVMMEVCDLFELEAVSLSGCQDEKGVRGIFAPSAAAERGFNYFFFFFFFSPRRDPGSAPAKFASSGC